MIGVDCSVSRMSQEQKDLIRSGQPSLDRETIGPFVLAVKAENVNLPLPQPAITGRRRLRYHRLYSFQAAVITLHQLMNACLTEEGGTRFVRVAMSIGSLIQADHNMLVSHIISQFTFSFSIHPIPCSSPPPNSCSRRTSSSTTTCRR